MEGGVAPAFSYSTPEEIHAARRAYLEKRCRFVGQLDTERAYRKEMSEAVRSTLRGRADIVQVMTTRLAKMKRGEPVHVLAGQPPVPSFKNDVDGDVMMDDAPETPPPSSSLAGKKYSEIFSGDSARRTKSMRACIQQMVCEGPVDEECMAEMLPFRTERTMLIAEILYNLKAAGQRTLHYHVVLKNLSQRPVVGTKKCPLPHTSECYLCLTNFGASGHSHVVSAAKRPGGTTVQYELCTDCHKLFKAWHMVCHWFTIISNSVTRHKEQGKLRGMDDLNQLSEKLCRATDTARRIVVRSLDPYVTKRLTYETCMEQGEFYNDPNYQLGKDHRQSGKKRPKKDLHVQRKRVRKE